MIFIIFIVFFNLHKYNNYEIDKSFLYKKWYHYNKATGYYDTIVFNDNSFEYNKPSNNSLQSKYDGCKKYNYDKKNNILNLDCGENIKIISNDANKLTLNIDSIKNVFFSSIEESLNYEFEEYTSNSISEYKKSMNQALELIKINKDRFFELIKSNENSTFIFSGKKCTSIECTLFLNVLEIWISTKDNIYYIDTNEIDEEDLKKLNKINGEFSININSYDTIYPKIYEISSGKIIDEYEIKCNGFDCSKYYIN